MVERTLSLYAEGLALRARRPAFSETIAPGEIVGLAGLDGHGQDVFLKALAGLSRPATGGVEARRGGGRVRIDRFRHAVREGIAYLPRDRRATGLFPSLSILDNFAIATAGRDGIATVISARRRRARYEHFRQRLSIVAPRPDQPITALSGGNQQKVLLARQLALDPAVLLLDDPTRGVDVATRHTLYGVFRDLARQGMALVVLSSEIDEILALCGRVLVFHDHTLAARLQGSDMTAERVIAAMFGRQA